MKRSAILVALAVSITPAALAQTTGPSGGLPKGFFEDPHQKGQAASVKIEEMTWGRLVNVHGLLGTGVVDPQPVYKDLVVNENIQTDGVDFRLETSAVTQATRLVVLREVGSTGFVDLVQGAMQGLPPIIPKHDNGSSSEPFSFVSRNAALLVRFDDLLADGEAAVCALSQNVKLLVGYPPVTPFGARMLFDRNHGGVVKGSFHSTRVIIDFTVSELESAGAKVPLPINALGLPASATTTGQPSVSMRIPTAVDAGSGQFTILTNLAGNPLSTTRNGPVDLTLPTREVVRAMRAGNAEDLNNGFLLDLTPPEIVGSWPLQISQALVDPMGQTGFDFLVDLGFTSSCADAPMQGAAISINGLFLEVSETAAAPDGQGAVADVSVRNLGDEEIDPNELLGAGLLHPTFDPASSAPRACWIQFVPQPGSPPEREVSPVAQLLVRFSEPMLPDSLPPFGGFRMVRGDSSRPAGPTTIVVADTIGSSDLREFVLTPVLPLGHAQGRADRYHAQVEGATDLAGNALVEELPPVDFRLDRTAPVELTRGLVLRFDSPDEFQLGPAAGALDLRGQFFYDLDRGVIRPRATTYFGNPADRTNPVPSIMVPFPGGTQTPLSPLGSKMQTVWRYVDVGWQVQDETKYNLDVTGLSWSPIGGQVIADFYEEFEIRLSHSNRLPDEDINPLFLLPKHPGSGLKDAPSFYTDNILVDPLSPQEVVHPRNLGYQVDPSDLFVGASGTTFMPFPLNQGTEPLETFLWRDTAVLAKGGEDGPGIPMDVEVGAPLFLDPGPAGRVAPGSCVPSFGLPLLAEFRCYPSNNGIGLNAFDINIAINSSVRPNFRAWSTGGINTAGQPVVKNPDLEVVPTGGFNPASNPPGKRTQFTSDNFYYIAQLDFVVRVSRVHTIFFDLESLGASFVGAILDPAPDEQPAGTQVIVEYRGARRFDQAGVAPFDAGMLDPYGDPVQGSAVFPGGDPTWSADLSSVEGARFLQMRFTFVNDVATGLNAELGGIGLAYHGTPFKILQDRLK